MASEVLRKLIDGVWRTVVADAADSGGSQPPVTREKVSGLTAVTIANGDTQPLLWDHKLQGDTLLDLSVPAAPTVITAGVYSFVCTTRPDAPLTVGGLFYAVLVVDALGDDAEVPALSPLAAVGSLQPPVALALTWYCPAGAQLALTVENDDGSASRDFRLSQAFIQRIS